jgi:alkaline phosphatase D
VNEEPKTFKRALQRPTRRRFMKEIGLAGGLAAAPAFVRSMRAAWMEDVSTTSSLFTLGVASGDPKEDSVVLWTRLAPDPLNGGGMGSKPVNVLWNVATDPAMTNIVRSGSATAHPKNGHALAVNVDGLQSNSWYYYQFLCSGQRSRIGRTKTFPGPDAVPSDLRFALVSCQNFENGFYAAYRDISAQSLDMVVHVGDYIYENGATSAVPAERRHNGGEIASVNDYRNRYALYRLDRHLQDAHAAFPFVLTWDDHEVDNNYAGLIPEDSQTLAEFRQRRTNAYQVYLETMPLRPERS